MLLCSLMILLYKEVSVPLSSLSFIIIFPTCALRTRAGFKIVLVPCYLYCYHRCYKHTTNMFVVSVVSCSIMFVVCSIVFVVCSIVFVVLCL